MKDKIDACVNGQTSWFERMKHRSVQGTEYWSGRELGDALGYTRYRNFKKVIEKARLACLNSGHSIGDHFVDVNKTIFTRQGDQRKVQDVLLSRYACYLCIQNSDPAQEIVARGQTYFAAQTRMRELEEAQWEEEQSVQPREEIRVHEVQLADAARSADVIEAQDFAVFLNHGYIGLHGTPAAASAHRRKGMNKSRKIQGHLNSAEQAANYFIVTQTEQKLRREHLVDKETAHEVQRQVGAKVKQTIRELRE